MGPRLVKKNKANMPYGGHVMGHHEGHEEKSGLWALQKEGLKSSEEEFHMMNIVAVKAGVVLGLDCLDERQETQWYFGDAGVMSKDLIQGDDGGDVNTWKEKFYGRK